MMGLAALALSLTLVGCQGEKLTASTGTASEVSQTEQSASQSEQKTEKSMAYQRITAEAAKKIIDTEKGYVIVDVRTPGEFAEGHIPGAINIPNETIGTEPPKELADKAQRILIYCRSGNRSRQASDKLVLMGYTQILDFGGITDWPFDVVK